MAEEVDRRKIRFSTLQNRLKDERLFVKQEKENLSKLNEKLVNSSQNLFYIEWKNRQHWINVDRLVWGGSANPSECSTTSRIIDSVSFEDAASILNYEDTKYGQLLNDLRENQRLVALILDYCDKKRLQTSTRLLSRLLIFSLYGGCADQKDELKILYVLKELINLQVLTCEDLLSFFCGKRSTENAFACVLTMFSEMLFSSKLYLTAALHGTVMQVIVGDSTFLDVEVNKVLSRIPPKATMEKFGKPGSPAANIKIKAHMEKLHKQLISLCKRFLKSLHDKIYCFPQSLRWTFGQLYKGMIHRMKLPQANAKAMIGYVLMSYFICPAIINPEPYGINSDADISETARHNLGQIASILRSLALLDCGLKDEKLKSILGNFEPGLIMSYVTSLLNGVDDIKIEDNYDHFSNITKCSILITENDLKTLINCLKLLQTFNSEELTKEGLDELLDTLPPPPRTWAKNKERNTKSMPPNLQLNVEATPSPPPRHKRLMKMNSDVTTANSADTTEGIEKLRSSLNEMIKHDESVLVIPLGNDTQTEPGMLPEEKVLGLNKEPQSPTAFDLYSTNEDKRRRASSLMLDALRDVFTEGKSLDTNSLDSLSSGSDVSTELNVIRSKPTNTKRPDPLDSVFLDTKTINDSLNDSVPVDMLLNFNEDDTFKPKLPVKKHSHKSVSSVMNDEPLISLENDMFNKSIHNTSSPRSKDHRIMSNVSQINDSGGINAILQNADVPSPTTVKNSEFHDPWSPSNFVSVDPWGVATKEPITPESPVGFENSFSPVDDTEKSVQVVPKKSSPSSKKKHSLDPKYIEYTETIQREQKQNILSKSPDNKLDETGHNIYRKKSHGAWFKNKITAGFRSALKQESADKEDISCDSQSIYKALDRQQNIKTGTPAQASEASKTKSMSIISRGSAKSFKDGFDESEAILAKYRNLTLEASSPSLDQSFNGAPELDYNTTALTSIKDEMVFDDEYKFNDAKRKLRTVLSTSAQPTLPSDAKSFDHLMMTMLQGKLAEAINLQDRFSVAQLHETLRSIKQLPTGSCHNLVEKLEEDYSKRCKYVSYLIKSKQGLLSSISHIEQITAKMQRDKTICSKYFTTLSVRLFLETQECKREIQIFAQKFASTKMLDEKCALLNDFLEKLNSDMVKDVTWAYSTDDQLYDAQVATERAIMSKIYKEAFYPNNVTDIENDRIFQEHIRRLSKVISLSHPALQIPKMFQKEAPWPSAQTELLMVNAYKTAADKLACIHRCSVTIMNLLSMASNKAPGADDFVPVLVYVVLKSNPPNLLSTKQYVNTFYETRLSGEEYYCWMQFCAAIEFIKTVRAPEGS